MKIVFVSGPYRGNITHNIKVARQHAESLWEQGFAVFCPHLNSANMDGVCPDANFLEGDLTILRRCDVIYMLPGWVNSVGAKKEHEEAVRLGMEVIYA